ncbi:30S ribosomal protein S2 [Lyticum sinuosum]|uniref:Small ribosomal subunit protein uS2 n=1 Tax=Lyticum sinuosum TaxID=1332059 RepID=A0AAE4VKF8_9RICK|nr:30S ribosomal protein S2 [Lyticum sinuosum]MDZ5761635.1 30S ribosomal protein S2 [Lyticum sinuosum]
MQKICTFTIKELLTNGVHIGHIELNPKMAKYVFGKRNNIHIIDLEQTAERLNIALNAIKSITSQNGRILFVSSRENFADITEKSAVSCGQYYVNKRWLGGMLTNRSTIENSIKTMREYSRTLQDEDIKMTKKEKAILQRKYDNLNRNLGGIRNMGGLPDLVIIIGKENKVALQEAKKLRIPICAIADTNFNPEEIKYVIPGNDDSIKSISFFYGLFAKAALVGIQESLGGTDIKLTDSNIVLQNSEL